MGITELIFALIWMAIPLALLVWFVKTLSAMAQSLASIASRLGKIERHMRGGAEPDPSSQA